MIVKNLTQTPLFCNWKPQAQWTFTLVPGETRGELPDEIRKNRYFQENVAAGLVGEVDHVEDTPAQKRAEMPPKPAGESGLARKTVDAALEEFQSVLGMVSGTDMVAFLKTAAAKNQGAVREAALRRLSELGVSVEEKIPVPPVAVEKKAPPPILTKDAVSPMMHVGVRMDVESMNKAQLLSALLKFSRENPDKKIQVNPSLSVQMLRRMYADQGVGA